MATTYTGYVQQLIAQQEAANAANERRYQQILGIYDQIASTYRPGGEVEQAFLSDLERTKTRDVAKATQSLVSSGLANTTKAATLPMAWEETVGTPARTQIRAATADKLAQILGLKAGAIERREDTGPGYAEINDLIKQGASQPSGGYSPAIPNSRASTYGITPTTGPSGGSSLSGGGGSAGTTRYGATSTRTVNGMDQYANYARLAEQQAAERRARLESIQEGTPSTTSTTAAQGEDPIMQLAREMTNPGYDPSKTAAGIRRAMKETGKSLDELRAEFSDKK